MATAPQAGRMVDSARVLSLGDEALLGCNHGYKHGTTGH
jgi:hypothetical protein